MFAKQYGWTPRQVDETDATTLDWLLGIQKVEAELQTEAREKQEMELKRTAAAAKGRRRVAGR